VKPMIILPPGTMSKEDMDQLRENGVCVVEAKEPAVVRFVDPIPVQSSRTQIEQASIELSRRLLSKGNEQLMQRKDIASLFVSLLTKGTPLSEGPTQAEHDAAVWSQAKDDELRRLAVEEARADRAEARRKKKEAAEAGKKPKPAS
jgi:hypothetical protein